MYSQSLTHQAELQESHLESSKNEICCIEGCDTIAEVKKIVNVSRDYELVLMLCESCGKSWEDD
jgi:hypothetical protein